MALQDHFRPPLSQRRHWDSFHGAWAEAIALNLNQSLLPEDEKMTTKSKFMTFLAAGILTSTVAAHAQTAMAVDPNLAPSTSGEESRILGTDPSSVQLAAAPDANVGPSTTVEEARIQATASNSPQLAAAPDPNLAPSTAGEEAKMQNMVAASASSASGWTQTIEQ